MVSGNRKILLCASVVITSRRNCAVKLRSLCNQSRLFNQIVIIPTFQLDLEQAPIRRMLHLVQCKNGCIILFRKIKNRIVFTTVCKFPDILNQLSVSVLRIIFNGTFQNLGKLDHMLFIGKRSCFEYHCIQNLIQIRCACRKIRAILQKIFKFRKVCKPVNTVGNIRLTICLAQAKNNSPKRRNISFFNIENLFIVIDGERKFSRHLQSFCKVQAHIDMSFNIVAIDTFYNTIKQRRPGYGIFNRGKCRRCLCKKIIPANKLILGNEIEPTAYRISAQLQLNCPEEYLLNFFKAFGNFALVKMPDGMIEIAKVIKFICKPAKIIKVFCTDLNVHLCQSSRKVSVVQFYHPVVVLLCNRKIAGFQTIIYIFLQIVDITVRILIRAHKYIIDLL